MTRLGNRIFTVLAALLPLFAATPAALSTPLRIGNEGDFRPFAFQGPDGKLQGFDIDVANQICQRLKMECEFVVQDFKGMIPALNANKFDLIVSSMTINEDRKKQVLFSKSYYQSVYSFAAPKDRPFEVSKSGLKGKTIGVVAAGAQRRWLQENFGDVVKIQLYDTPADLRADMLNGRIDGTIATMPYLHGAYMEGDLRGKFVFVGETLKSSAYFGEGVGIATRLGNTELIQKVNDAIDAMYADGTFKRINDKYFPFSIAR
jgi:lysine-arginine-ornithine-binding protein